MRSSARRVARRLASVRPSGRSVEELPAWAGFGNQLFYYLRAFREQRAGRDLRLVVSDRGRSWVERFPALAELTVPAEAISLRDAREDLGWEDITRFGTDFTREDLAAFIDHVLQPVLGIRPGPDQDVLTINLRRGDYFSDPAIRGRMAFDQLAYLEAALPVARGDRPGGWHTIRVVSDDPGWCQVRLQHLRAWCDDLVIDAGGDPVADLRAISSARELVIVNSTFSMWGGYVSSHVHGPDAVRIIAPAFATRPFTGTPAVTLDPAWTIITDIPGGWDS